MLHLLIHAQLGYLLHPLIKLPEATSSEEPLLIADVGTGTGYDAAMYKKSLTSCMLTPFR